MIIEPLFIDVSESNESISEFYGDWFFSKAQGFHNLSIFHINHRVQILSQRKDKSIIQSTISFRIYLIFAMVTLVIMICAWGLSYFRLNRFRMKLIKTKKVFKIWEKEGRLAELIKKFTSDRTMWKKVIPKSIQSTKLTCNKIMNDNTLYSTRIRWKKPHSSLTGLSDEQRR